MLIGPATRMAPIRGDANKIDVSVIVVNFNGMAFLKDCLDSLPGALRACSSEVIVVDNASTDGSREYLKARRDIRLIELEINSGFCAGNNIGVRAARGKFALLLNSDTVCLSGFAPLLACMDDERCGVAGCALLYADGRVQPSVGFDHTPSRLVLSWLGLRRVGINMAAVSRAVANPGYYRLHHRQIDWVSGACMLARIDLWRRIGGFDEMFFMYCEDVDYCRRVRKAGYTVCYTPDTSIRHYEASGKAWVGRLALLRTTRSYLLFVRKHFGAISQLSVATLLGLILLLRSAVYWGMGLLRAENDVTREKVIGYADAAIYLFRHGLARKTLRETI